MATSENPDKETRQNWHDDPSNWKLEFFYFNPKDKRIFPPKRIGFGWTINFANFYSVLIFVGFLALVILTFKLYSWQGSTIPR